MGLLDEAIRDHLELKRRRGADPGEVAREQREALDTAQQPLPHSGPGDEPDAASATDDRGPSAPAAPGAEGMLDRETAELDMSTVLAGDVEATRSVIEEDSLTWEMPDRGGAPQPDEASSRAGLE